MAPFVSSLIMNSSRQSLLHFVEVINLPSRLPTRILSMGCLCSKVPDKQRVAPFYSSSLLAVRVPTFINNEKRRPPERDTSWDETFDKDFMTPGSERKYKRERPDGGKWMPEDEFNAWREAEYKKFQARMANFRADIIKIPNILSMLRLASVGVICPLIWAEQHSLALSLFVVSGLTDAADGLIARYWPSQASALGNTLDPIADKILVSFTAIALAFEGYLPMALLFTYLTRDMFVLLAAGGVRYLSLNEPRTLRKFMNLEYKPIRWRPTRLGKANTVLQVATISACLASPVFSFVEHPTLISLCTFSAGFTFVTFIAMFFSPKLYDVAEEFSGTYERKK